MLFLIFALMAIGLSTLLIWLFSVDFYLGVALLVICFLLIVFIIFRIVISNRKSEDVAKNELRNLLSNIYGTDLAHAILKILADTNNRAQYTHATLEIKEAFESSEAKGKQALISHLSKIPSDRRGPDWELINLIL